MSLTRRVKFSDILVLSYGKPLDPKDRNESGEVPVYGANGIKTYADKYLIDFPTIIVGRKGSAGELNFSEGPCWPLDVTYFVEHDPAVTDLTFLFYLLKAQNLPALARGIKPGINRNDVYSMEADLPTIDEQCRIVENLTASSAAIHEIRDRIRRQDECLATLERAILMAAFRREQ